MEAALGRIHVSMQHTCRWEEGEGQVEAALMRIRTAQVQVRGWAGGGAKAQIGFTLHPLGYLLGEADADCLYTNRRVFAFTLAASER